MNRYLLVIGLFLAALVLGAVVSQRRMKQPSASVTAAADKLPTVPSVPSIRGKAAPDFELANLEGAKIHPADFKGKALLVNFWATWCAPCIVEIPWFIEFQQKYGPQGLQVVGISMDDTGVKDVIPFVKKHNMTYPILMGDDKVAQQFGGILGLPTTFMVDKNGKYYAMHRGLVSRERVEEEIQEMLGQSSSAASPAAKPASATGSADEECPMPEPKVATPATAKS